MTATPNHALQRTAPQSLSLEVVRRQRARHPMRLLLLCLSLGGALASTSLADTLTEYQLSIVRLRESLYGPAGDDLARPPKLDEATENRIKGELLRTDPYWRLEQQIADDLKVLGEHYHGDNALTQITAAYVDIASLIHVWSRQRIPPTKDKAEVEVQQLRICLFRRDVAAVEKLFKTWNQ